MTSVEQGLWTTATAITWLRELGVTMPVLDGLSRVPDMADEHIVVTRTPGPGEALEGAADVPGVQLRFRGRQNTPGSPENTALAVDRLIRFHGWPVLVGGVYVQHVTRSGGAPAPLAPTLDTADRAEWTCTYLTTVMEAPA